MHTEGFTIQKDTICNACVMCLKFNCFSSLRTVKIKQRKLADQANSLTDFAKVSSENLIN